MLLLGLPNLASIGSAAAAQVVPLPPEDGMTTAGTLTTGTYDFGPYLSDLIIHAYGRCQVRRTALTSDHLADAAVACNLLQVEWSNRQVNLWTVDLQSIPLTPGVATYNVDPSTVMIMAAYIATGTSPERDRVIISIDRDTYASYPDKETQGPPTVYWFNKLILPTITVWQPPDGSGPYTLKFYRARQIQDASVGGPLQPEVPYRFLDAYVSELAFRLAEIYAPARMQELSLRAKQTWDEASQRDIENAPLRIVPALWTYAASVY